MPELGKVILPVGGHQNKPVDPPEFTELVIGTDKYKINKEGNAVDDKGVVLKTKDELEKLKTPDQTDAEKEAARLLLEKTAHIETVLVEGAEIELDGVKHVLTKDGTIVKDGKVLKTKDELKALLLAIDDPGNTDVDYISEIQKATNLIITNEDKPVTYENTVTGITQYVQDVYQEGSKLGAEQFEQALVAKFPILPQIIEHLTIHGSLKDFNEEVDYSKIVLGDDENQHIDLFTKAKKAQGLSDSEILDMVKYYKEDKKLKSAAETGLTFLKTNQQTSATNRATQVATLKAQQEARETAYWAEVDKALSSKELVLNEKKFKIPDIIKIKDASGKIITKTPADFKKYIEQPLNFNINGQIYTMTQHDYDEHVEDTKRTPHHDLFDAFRRFTKYDDSQIIAANISSNTVKQIIKLNSKTGGGVSGAAQKGAKIVLPIK